MRFLIVFKSESPKDICCPFLAESKREIGNGLVSLWKQSYFILRIAIVLYCVLHF